MIDYTTSDAPEFALAPEGSHNSIITKAEIYNNANGPDKIIVTFSLESGEEHREFVIPRIMEGEGFQTFANLLAMVSDEDSLPNAGAFDEQDLVGLECMIEIKHREYKGKTYANVLKVEEPKKPKKK